MSNSTTIELDAIVPAPGDLGTAPKDDAQVEQNSGLIPEVSNRRAAAVIGTVAGVTFLNTMGSGILTVALPRIAKELHLSRELLLCLTCGCTLLLAGAIGDIVGRKKVYLAGCGLFAVFTLGCGLSPNSLSLIIFRGFQGASISLCLTTAVGIVTNTFPPSTKRNIAFACLGAGSPVGYSLGLVLGGVFVETVGWRYAYYLAAIVNTFVFAAAVFGIPGDEQLSEQQGSARVSVWKRLATEVDWTGALMATLSLSLLSYVLAVVTGSASSIRHPVNIALLVIAIALLPTFVFWVGRQERLGKPAIIPNSLWRSSAFTTSCVTVFFTWAAFNSFGYFATLYFQEVQLLSALQTSLRLIPTVVCGFLTNVATGFLVKKTPASYLVGISSIFSAVACLLMALSNPHWIYWSAAFVAIFLSPMSSDVLYTISNLIIADAFPLSRQSLAGGVFNTVAQIGNSVGLAITAVIASTVAASKDDGKGPESIVALLEGYRATFWTCFAAILFVAGFSAIGLRKAGKVGLKKE